MVSLTAVQTSRPVDFSWIAVSECTANARCVSPHHLGEMAPGVVVVRLSIRVLLLLLMPAMGGGASKLDPVIGSRGGWLLRGEVTAGAHLHLSINTATTIELLLNLRALACRCTGRRHDGLR